MDTEGNLTSPSSTQNTLTDCLASLQASFTDVKRNFDDNVTSPLDALLSKLSSTEQDIGDFDFARAGFVIATGAGVYAKKLDYLCHLVRTFSAELSGKSAHEENEERRPRRQNQRTTGLLVDLVYVNHENMQTENGNIDDLPPTWQQPPPLRGSGPTRKLRQGRQSFLLVTSPIAGEDDKKLNDMKDEEIGRKATFFIFGQQEPAISDATRETTARRSSPPASFILNQHNSGHGSLQLEQQHVEQHDTESHSDDVADTASQGGTRAQSGRDEPTLAAPRQCKRRLDEETGSLKANKGSSTRRRHVAKNAPKYHVSQPIRELISEGLTWARETACPLSPAKARRLHRGEELPRSQQQTLLQALELLKTRKRRSILRSEKDSPKLGDACDPTGKKSPDAVEKGSQFRDNSLRDPNIEGHKSLVENGVQLRGDSLAEEDVEDANALSEPADADSDGLSCGTPDNAVVTDSAVESKEMRIRVIEWENYIQPLLAAEEERKPFDIWESCDSIMHTFEDTPAKQTRSFKEVCAGARPWEVARYFAATLQLANSGNVSLTNSGDMEDGMDTLNLTLLSRVQNFRDLEELGTASNVRKQPASRRNAAVSQGRQPSKRT